MFQKIKDIAALIKIAGQVDKLRKEVDQEPNMKNILLSKTFWTNVLTLVGFGAGVLPEHVAIPVLAVANIGLRLVSNQPVTISIPWKK